MENKIAKIIAWVFQPLLMAAIGSAFIIFGDIYFPGIPILQKLIILVFITSTTFFIPALVVIGMLRNGIIKDLMLDNRRDRYYPLAATIVFYSVSIFLLKNNSNLDTIRHFMFTVLAAIVITFLVNLKYKISLHMTGCAGVFGLLLYLQLQPGNFFIPHLMFWSLVCGAVAFARLQMKAHSITQIALGTLCGAAVVYFGMHLLS